MNVYKTERIFKAAQNTVFSYITETEHLLSWWGPEGLSIKEHNLDLSQLGPWSSTLVNAEGGIHKMSGEVFAFNPPTSVEFTWAWHNNHDERGRETRVRLEVSAAENGGTKLVLTHSGFESREVADKHDIGWSSALRKLERMANS
ncbi:MAG: SRPBCC domain-containing protein [Hyphomicrobiales bacterium]